MALRNVTESEELLNIGKSASQLVVSVNSFSYKRGIPVDISGNGGGHVFDTRCLHNPGKYPQYKDKTGRDAEVIEFFSKEPDVKEFLDSVYKIVSQSVETYMSRGFRNLMVSFGCTGGQHRSVYCAERLSDYLKEKYDVKVVLKHVEQEMKGM